MYDADDPSLADRGVRCDDHGELARPDAHDAGVVQLEGEAFPAERKGVGTRVVDPRRPVADASLEPTLR
jgi:hypothetical protein